MHKKTWQIWSEMCVEAGKVYNASLRGEMRAYTFRLACVEFFANDKAYDAERNMHHGLRLFDNKFDARHSINGMPDRIFPRRPLRRRVFQETYLTLP